MRTSLKKYKQCLQSHVSLLKRHNMVLFGWKWKSKFKLILNTIQTYYLNKDCSFAVFITLCFVLQLSQSCKCKTLIICNQVHIVAVFPQVFMYPYIPVTWQASCSVKTPTNSHDFHRAHNSSQEFSLQRLIWRWVLWIYFTEEWQGPAHYSTQIPVSEWEHL